MIDQRIGIRKFFSDSITGKQNSKVKSGRRNKLDIVSEILLCCLQRCSKKHIWYQTELNYSKLQRYLSFLIANEMLAAGMEDYIITKKGYEFLELYSQINNLMI